MDQNIVILVLLLIAILVAFYSAYLALDTSKKVRKVQSDLKETLTSIENDMDELDKDINEAMTKLEETIDKRIKLSLDNPLSQIK